MEEGEKRGCSYRCLACSGPLLACPFFSAASGALAQPTAEPVILTAASLEVNSIPPSPMQTASIAPATDVLELPSRDNSNVAAAPALAEASAQVANVPPAAPPTGTITSGLSASKCIHVTYYTPGSLGVQVCFHPRNTCMLASPRLCHSWQPVPVWQPERLKGSVMETSKAEANNQRHAHPDAPPCH